MSGMEQEPDVATDDFWSRFRRRVEVVVGIGEPAPYKLLGVRDGFERYLRHALARDDRPSVRAESVEPRIDPLPVSDGETLDLARTRARAAERATIGRGFSAAVETGVVAVTTGTTTRHLVRTWAVLIAPVGLAMGTDGRGDEAWGSSGALEVPRRLVDGLEQGASDSADSPAMRRLAIPGTLRAGGMVASITGGLETRREAVALATCRALTSLLYGRLGGPRGSEPQV